MGSFLVGVTGEVLSPQALVFRCMGYVVRFSRLWWLLRVLGSSLWRAAVLPRGSVCWVVSLPVWGA